MGKLKRWALVRKPASFTLESSFIMPWVIACVLFLISMNFYLHDQVVFESLAVETAYSESLTGGKAESYFAEQASERAFLLENIEFSQEEQTYRKVCSFEKSFSLPFSGLMAQIMGDTGVILKGKTEKLTWKTSDLLRYLTQNRRLNE